MLKNDNNEHHIERRKYPRVPVKIKLDCEIPQTGETSFDGLLQFQSKNISSGGVFLEGIKNLPEGYVVCIEFKLPEIEKSFTVKGIVIWSGKRGSGVRFMTLNIDDFEIITDYIDRSLPSS